MKRNVDQLIGTGLGGIFGFCVGGGAEGAVVGALIGNVAGFMFEPVWERMKDNLKAVPKAKPETLRSDNFAARPQSNYPNGFKMAPPPSVAQTYFENDGYGGNRPGIN